MLLALAFSAAPLAAQQLKIATLAPDGSSWMEVLNAAADEVKAQTDGKVVTRFYPGGVMGGSDMVLRRMKLGQLQGGVFTVGELAGVAPETNLYSLPFQFKNASELAQLRDEFDPFILDALHEAGSIALARFSNARSKRRRVSPERSQRPTSLQVSAKFRFGMSPTNRREEPLRGSSHPWPAWRRSRVSARSFSARNGRGRTSVGPCARPHLHSAICIVRPAPSWCHACAAPPGIDPRTFSPELRSFAAVGGSPSAAHRKRA